MGASPSRQEGPSSSSYAGNGHAVGTGSNHAQSNSAPAPHMFQEIVAEKKTTTASALGDQLYTGIFLAGKTKKYWVDKKTRHNCFMLFPRGLSITWSEDPRFWTWKPLKEGRNKIRSCLRNYAYFFHCSESDMLTQSSDADTQIEMVSLQNVCWLEIHGKLELSYLTPGVTYEVIFEVMLVDPAYGWSVPVNLQLKFPDGNVQQRKESMQENKRWKWLKLKVGEVKTQQGQKGELEISMFEYDGEQWKRGLLIKGIKILPKQ